MKNIIGKEPINKIVNNISQRKNNPLNRAGHIFIASLILCFIYVDIVCADSGKVIGQHGEWKEIQLAPDAVEYAWCGDRQIVFGDDKYRKSSKGIFIYDLNSGLIEHIANDPDHSLDLRDVSCTADSRYVVFVRKEFGKNDAPNNLFIFDRETKTIKRYTMKDGWLHLSPNANYVVGPALPQGQKYILPGGKEVKLVPSREGTLAKIELTHLQWSDDEKTIFLFDNITGRLTKYDIEKDKLNTSLIKKIKDSFEFREMRITKDNKLYVSAVFYTPKDMEVGILNLYLFDLEKPSEKPILLDSDIIGDFDMDSEGNLVYFKDPDDKHSEIGIYYLKKGKKQAQLVQNYNCLKNCHALKISRNGKGIIFARSTGYYTKEFIILIRNSRWFSHVD